MPGQGNSTHSAAPTVPNRTMPVPDDSELVRRVVRGDPSALGTLVERHARYLFGIAHGLTGNAADAEDIVQETFAAVLKTRFRGESAVRTWLVQILVRQAGMLRRKHQRRGPLQAIEPDTAVDHELARPAGGDASDARLDLETMLAVLTPEHRAVIVLRELQGMSYDQMAATLNIPRGTVESRLHRAREELRRRFEGYL